MPRPNYGIDAPGVVRNFALAAMAAFGAALALSRLGPSLLPPTAASSLELAAAITGAWCLGTVAVMLWGSRFGKRRLARRVVAGLALGGTETILDVGCGHGLLLIAAARALPRGRAVGIDIWQEADQAGNSAAATRQNARIEGVAERVALAEADARRLPFADATFDAVVSSWALHNIADAHGRDTALREIVRVLKPGGRATIIDIRHTRAYATTLGAAGMTDLSRSARSFLFVTPTYTVTARR